MSKPSNPHNTICSEATVQKMLPCYEVCFSTFIWNESWGILPLNLIASGCKCLAALKHIPGTPSKSLKPNHTLCSEVVGQKNATLLWKLCFSTFIWNDSWGILPLNHIASGCKCLAALKHIPGTPSKSLKPNHTLCSRW